MTFISYAQNFEDVMLWRALQHIENGFYIDIGAQDPIFDSVSYAFYQKGWRGVSIEPTEQYSAKLKKYRKDEFILQAAIGNDNGFMRFFEFPDTGLSTASEQIAMQHRQSNYEPHETIVPVISMDSLLNQFEGRQIHWLKIDVEGFEHNVIQSWGKSLVRPWVLVIESTLPSSQVLSHYNWDNLILAKGYRFAYFDGLNRFYVHEKHLNLFDKLIYPPNIFDSFISADAYNDKQNNLKLIQDLDAKISEINTIKNQNEDLSLEVKNLKNTIQNLQQKEQQLQHAKLEIANLQHQIYAIYASKSWHITKPLRFLTSQTRPLIKKVLRPILEYSLNFIQKKPKLKYYILRLIKFSPKLERRLKQFVQCRNQNMLNVNSTNLSICNNNSNLSPYAFEIYNKLKLAIQNKKEGK